MIIVRTTLIVALLSAVHAVPAHAVEEWKPARTWTCGTQFDAWAVAEGESGGPDLPIVHIWHAGGKTDPAALPEQKPALPPISGRIQHATADRDAMQILFTDLSTGEYSPLRPWAAGAGWRRHSFSPPLAWGGDVIDPLLYAVVRNRSLIPLTTGPADDSRTSAAIPDPKVIHDPELIEADIAPDGVTLMILRLGSWRRIPGPPDAAAAEKFWITGRQGQAILFYRLGDFVFQRSYRETWSERLEVCESARLQQGWASAIGAGPVWIAGFGDSPESVQVHLHVMKEGAWEDLGPAREGTELLSINPRTDAASIARENLAITRISPEKGMEFGFGDIGPTPLIRFSPLGLRRAEPALDQQWRDTMVLAILLGILSLVMWTRRNEIARHIVLPPEVALAAVWKRAVASVFDLLPAMLAVAPWWWPKLEAIRAQMIGASGELLAAEIARTMNIEIYAIFVAHGLWCLVFEALMSTTPGKMLFSLRVVGTDGERPSIRQCLIRNATRSIMLSLGGSGLIVTLMTMIIVSRNRQRVGDLLARTLVLGPASLVLDETPPPQE